MAFTNALYRIFRTLALVIMVINNPVASADESTVYKLGVVIPLSGEAASIGVAVQNGMELALSSLEPEVRKRIKVIYEDDGFQPKLAVSALEKLKGEGITTLVGAGSATGKALSSISESAGITFISISSSQEVSRGKKRVFNFWVTPEQLTESLIPEVQRRGLKRIAMVSSVHEGMLALKGAFDSANKGIVEVVVEDEFTHDIKDFKRFIGKVRSIQGIDGILVNLLPGQSGIFVKQLRELGVTLPVFSYEVFADPSEVLAAQGALKGQWYVNAASADPTFAKRYAERFPGASNWGAANGHDVILMIGAAVREQITPSNFPDYLKALKDFNGACGTYSATGDNRFSLPAEVLVVP